MAISHVSSSNLSNCDSTIPHHSYTNTCYTEFGIHVKFTDSNEEIDVISQEHEYNGHKYITMQLVPRSIVQCKFELT